MGETAQNAPVGLGVMNGKHAHLIADAYNLSPFIKNEVSDVSFCLEQIANAMYIFEPTLWFYFDVAKLINFVDLKKLMG